MGLQIPRGLHSQVPQEKGKSAIHLARVYGEKKRNFVGQHFWARGYFVSTVGRDQELIREYIRKQEAEDTRLEQLNLWRWVAAFGRLLQTGGASAPPAAAFSGSLLHWGRVSDPTAASSGSSIKAPGFAGGYLLNCEHPRRSRRPLGFNGR
jgi:hypothetical protein